MKIGIDSYCYHRFFGEIYPGQEPPKKKWTMDDFLDRAKELEVDGVSLESCFLPGAKAGDESGIDDGYLKDLKGKLDAYGFERVYAWGHPDGLERGLNEKAFKDMCDSIRRANLIGAKVMRVCGSSLMFRHEPHGPQIDALVAQFKQAMKIADEYGIKIADENHIDYTADEMLQIIEGVGNPNFGINFDTGNFLRLLDDPIAGMEKLAPYTFATHIKDLQINYSAKPTDWFFFSTVPVGKGMIDNFKLAEMLKKANYQGFLAVELDMPHPDWTGCEDEAVSISVKNLRAMANKVG
jgi:sugar phosphate isomerase/epimerase